MTIWQPLDKDKESCILHDPNSQIKLARLQGSPKKSKLSKRQIQEASRPLAETLKTAKKQKVSALPTQNVRVTMSGDGHEKYLALPG